jgi:peptidoglycan/xylan/chitin deacetylase (PgdA/CDA1 family)/2-polyprenyl-3-methyl-5-hydroxy-6-metoxy-1,4-benzoquinol methylase/GT2 family glycosyltransferase
MRYRFSEIESTRSGISVIIPAHNAEATLEATVNSVLLQTHTVWEAVIVDDGSTDGTRAMAEGWADRDRRIRALHQEKSGVSAARNSGLRKARYPFVLFLDSDDRIAPTHLERMVSILLADPRFDAVHCGWQRILPSGALGPPHLGSDHEDLFEYFAFQCIFAIHACVLRRDLALAVGGFDTSLTTCEDWDFFQRVARTGARFGRVPEVLAFYQARANSASQDSRRYLTDARVVLDRGHGRDPRMRIAPQVHAEGRDPAYRNLALYYIVTYLAAQEIGAGRDGLDLLDASDFPLAPDLPSEAVASIIQEPLLTAANRSEQEWPALWSEVNAPLAAFLARLEAQTGAPALAFATLRHLEKKILLAEPDDSPLLLGSTYRVNVDLARRVPDVFLPPEADRLICRLAVKGEPIGAVELPGIEVVTGRRIAEATLEGRRRLLLRLLLRSALTPSRGLYVGLATVRNLLRRRTLRLLWDVLAAMPKDRLSAVRRVTHEVASVVRVNLSRVLAMRPSLAASRADRQWHKYLDTAAAAGRVHAREEIDTQGPNEWDRVFALPDPWAYESDYEAVKYAQTLALMPEGLVADALEIACAEGHFTVRLAPRVGRLTAVDISERALARARARCASHGNITFQALDLNGDEIPGPFDLIVCSEVLYYVRDLAGVISRILSQLRPGGLFLTAHARVLADDPERIGFNWNQAFGVETIAHTIAAQPGVVLRRELRAPLYRVLLYQRFAPGQQPGQPEIVETDRVGRLTPVAEAQARWPGRPPIRLAVERACSVPILMYHRIAADGPVALERFRVAPDLFALQMATLHRAGYRTIDLGNWISALARHEPLRGKPIILTFDDGYRDFLIAAMPVLRAHGFSASVFLVGERIGGTAGWDAGYGEPAPLLSWEEVRALQEAGIEFGCHSSAHRPMTGMRLPELAEDTVRARAILEEGLATSVKTLAYPYGAENGFVRRVIADLGFRAAVSCEPGLSRLGDDPLRLPRIEVPGGCTPERLLASIDHVSSGATI